MQYLISFLEGIITFISPCLLPMLPIYVSYFAGGGERSTARTLRGALGFVLGCTLERRDLGFFSALVFGVVFSVGWTPCVGAFLGSALALASQQGHVLAGMLMLLLYSLGLGLPFILSALLIDKLKTAFDWIKRHYGVINTVCGALLVLIGVLMATGTLGRLLTALS